MALETRWQQTLNSLKLDGPLADACGRELLKRYASRQRHYHGLRHVENLLDQRDLYRSELAQPEWVALAIWYHDAIYNSLRHDNELRSARLAAKHLHKLGLAPEAIEIVSLMIQQTAQHLGPLLTDHPDLPWFLDFDLGILGASPAAYDRYAEQVRREYGLFPEGMYRKGRIGVLRHLLQADFLYRTPTFRREYERQARQNLLRELRQWEA